MQAVSDILPEEVKILPVSVRYSQPYPSWGTEVKVDIGSPLSASQYLGTSLRQSSQQLTKDLQKSLCGLYEIEDNLCKN